MVFIPSRAFGFLKFFIWPKESRRRYRTAIFAVFLVALLAANLDSPKYWNGFADWINPKLDAVDMPEPIRRLDKWEVLKKADDIIALPHFWNLPFSQGLDLQGGIHLIYKADLSNITHQDHGDAMNGLRDVIERRVNLFGVREPKVLVQEASGEYRLLVELAGITDFNEAIQLIGQTPYLEFKEERPKDEQKRLLREVLDEDQEGVTDAQLEGICSTINPQFLLIIQESGKEDPCFKVTGLTGQYLKEASVQFDPNTNQPTISLQLDDEGSKLFEQITARNVDKPLAIYLDKVLRSAPRVQEKIVGGKAQITGFDIKQAKQIARDLNAGALPVPITLISQQSIGAALGEESLRESLRAGILGIIAVVAFMIILYRLSGLLAVISLAVYLSLLLAILKLVPVTLTLPGIAGLILSIGMAVDANVLVFERLREEFQRKKEDEEDFLFILNRAYGRAWNSIRDGNISTLLTCTILFWFSTSFIKGFALTLGIGVVVSMFSAMIVTRYLMRLVGEGRLRKKEWLWIR